MDGCDAVVASLPYHFADPDGLRAYANSVRSDPGFVAVDGGQVVGFVTLDRHGPQSVEIAWLAVHADRRRARIGRQLVEAARGWAATEGAAVLCVMTVGPSAEEPREKDTYADTRRFYESNGFTPVRELNLEGWNWPALLLVTDTKTKKTQS